MDIEKMIADYANWIKGEISVSKYGEFFELTTPYLDRYNDYLQIYVKQVNDNSIILTDDGYIIGNLLSSGMSFRAGSKRKYRLDRILQNYSLELGEDNSIRTRATPHNFPQKKHAMVQAMIAIDDMFELNPHSITEYFVEDIQMFLDANDIYYSRDFSLMGKTGSIYTYDFHFQKTKKLPERFLKAINHLTRSNRDMTIFNWIDTQEKRNHEGQLIVMLNDEYAIQQDDLSAFNNYDILPVKFSERTEYLHLFSAA